MSAASKTPDFIVIGQIVKPHGILGAVKVLPLTDDPQRFKMLEKVYVGEEDQPKSSFAVKKVQIQHDQIILSLDGITSRDEAEMHRREYVQIPMSETMPLPDGAFYFYQLVGLRMITNAGDPVGVVKNIESYPAHDMFVVSGDEHDILIPDVPEIVEKVDIDAGEIVINPIPGLID